MPPDAPRGRYYSVSSTQRYEECPQAFKFEYVDRIKRPESEVPEHWRFGSVVHAGFEAVYLRVKEEGLDLPAQAGELDGLAADAVRAAWEQYEMPRTGGELDRAIGLVLEGITSHPPLRGAHILGVEHKFVHVTPDGTIVIAYADLVERVDENSVKITDHKITTKTKTAAQLVDDLQGNAYGWLATQEWPWVSRVYFTHHYPPAGQRVGVELDPEGMADAVCRIEAVAEMAETDRSYTPRVSEACEWCTHKGICPAWQETDVRAGALADASRF